jgi:site-specific recombinase XerC
VRDYRTHLAAVLKRSNATINNAPAAIDDFYTRTGLGPAAAQRLDLAPLAPRALTGRAVTRWLRAAGTVESARDRALILTPFYAGARIGETVALDLDDVRLSARKGSVRFYGKGAKPRQVGLAHE